MNNSQESIWREEVEQMEELFQIVLERGSREKETIVDLKSTVHFTEPRYPLLTLKSLRVLKKVD